MKYKIIENSLLAGIGRIFMRSSNLALTLGNRIHLSGVKKDDFLKDKKWLSHELIHIEQYKKYGMLKFLFLYLLESLKKGYYKNKFEVEARNGSEK